MKKQTTLITIGVVALFIGAGVSMYLKSDIAMGVFVALFVLAAIGLFLRDVNNWNHGKCTCGGRWMPPESFFNTGHSFRCNKCGKDLWIFTKR